MVVRTAHLLLGALLLSAACRDRVTICDAGLHASLQVDVVDATTGEPAAAGATVILRGPTSDSVTVPATPAAVTAQTWYENQVNSGLHSVTVRKPGYREWTRANIPVDGPCHMHMPEHVVARLERLP